MSTHDEVRQLIDTNPEIVDFADFGDGIEEVWISRAESALGFRLPESYKWWLRNFSGGEIGGEEIYSIYEEDFDTVVGGDIVCMYRLQSTSSNRIPICHSDIDGVFSFDRSLAAGEEYPIVSEGTDTIYATDFLEFVEKRITSFQTT